MLTDILMVTYNRPAYTRLSLARLLETADEHTRIWLWQNGSDAETLEVVKSLAVHPKVRAFHHSEENVDLDKATNWFWANADGEFLGKVDDDCVMPHGWIQTLRTAHNDEPRFGPISCWHYFDDDLVPGLYEKRIQEFAGGHKVMRNCWIGGTGYIMKRDCVDRFGPLNEARGWTNYCLKLSRAGWVLGWYWPLISQDHMDDPRSPNTGVRTDEELAERMPRMARGYGVRTVDDWIAWLKRDARKIQESSLDPRDYSGWRRKMHKARRKIARRRSGGNGA